MSRTSRRREQRKHKAALVDAGTWKPKPPVGRLALVYRIAPDLAPAVAADIDRGRKRAKKVLNVAVSDT